eukprot:1147647-Rhodomonas_salina.1
MIARFLTSPTITGTLVPNQYLRFTITCKTLAQPVRLPLLISACGFRGSGCLRLRRGGEAEKWVLWIAEGRWRVGGAW